MNIIHTTSALAPEFGGPARTIPALCVELAKLGNSVTILYLDFGDIFEEPVLPSHPNLNYQSLRVSIRLGMRPVLVPGYKSTLMNLASDKAEMIFHDNGIWLPYSSQVLKVAKKFGAPVITTIHGMLEPWPMSYGRLRKLAAWHSFQKRRLQNNSILHATCRDEAKNLRALGLENPITIIPNGTYIPDLSTLGRPVVAEKKTILFLSRIHPKKGLLNFVKAIDHLRPLDWKAVIAGYDEQGYQETVEIAVREAGLEDFFSFIGPVNDLQKWDLYNNADLFILPSHSENFGIVVAEALAVETPVITTRVTPWEDLVDYNCGWWVEPTVPDLVASLRNAFEMDDHQRKIMGQNGRKLVEKKYCWPAIAKDLNSVYQWLLGSRKIIPETIV